MSRLGWYARRLSTMSPGEIGWRVAGAARAVLDERRAEPGDGRLLGTRSPDWAALHARFRDAHDRPVLLDRDRAARLAREHPDRVTAVLAAADEIVAGRVRYFGYPQAQLADPVDWHHDLSADVHWPARPSRRLDHRSAEGDAKWIWELNRLQHLPLLAQSWLYSGDDRYARTAFAHLDGWCAQNPPGVGIAWRGAFEAGIRAISVAVALQGLRDSELCTPARYRALVRLLAESARRCWAERSRYSSANNHLVGELAGLAVVSLLHPEIAGSARGLRRALDGLGAEAGLQILPDGGGAEQSVPYQLFTGDLLLVVAALARRGGHPVPEPVTAALTRGARHLAILVRDGEPAPRFGDDDEGFALRLDTEDVPDVRSHLASVADVTGESVARRYGTPGLTAAWFAADDPAGPAVPNVPDAGPPSGDGAEVPPGAYFPDTGLVVLRPGGRRVTMDVGPLGYLGIAAHGHADALSITLCDGRAELVGDPGAGSYYGHPDRRAAHRGTPAHATVTVDGLDQSVSGGPFLWTRKAAVTVHEVNVDSGVVDAEHDGYTRLADPVRHRRRLVALGDAGVLVVDRLDGAGHHDVVCSWPVHPALQLEERGPDVGAVRHVLSRNGVPALTVVQALAGAPAPEPVRIHGDAVSGLGWWSDRLEARTPSWVVGLRAAGPLPTVVATVLSPAPHAAPEGVEVRQDGATIIVSLHRRDAAKSPSVTVSEIVMHSVAH